MSAKASKQPDVSPCSFVRFRTFVAYADNSARSFGMLTKHGKGFWPGPRIRVEQVCIAAGKVHALWNNIRP